MNMCSIVNSCGISFINRSLQMTPFYLHLHSLNCKQYDDLRACVLSPSLILILEFVIRTISKYVEEKNKTFRKANFKTKFYFICL